MNWTGLAALLCFGYGVAFTLNIHPIGDGLWFWYARLFREGNRLYSGMHLPLQPLFVLLTAWTQEVFGLGWLASKMLAFVQLLLFCWGLFLVARRIAWKDWQTAVLLGAAFMMTLTADYFRFDDYHITGYCLEVFSIYLLLRLGEEVSVRFVLLASVLLGILSGLSMSNRLNDGAALLGGCAVALWFAAKGSRFPSLGSFFLGASTSFFSIILLTHDSLRDWWTNSIARAATIKGGTVSVLKGPLHLLKWQLRYVLSTRHMLISLALVAIVVLGLMKLSWWRRDARREGRWMYWVAALGVVGALVHSTRRGPPGWTNMTIGAYLTLLLIGLTCWGMVRGGRQLYGDTPAGWQWREILIIIPFLQVVAGGATSGLAIYEVLPAIGFFLLLMPLTVPQLVSGDVGRRGLIALSSVVIVSGLYFKTVHPYEWHHFVDRELFTERTWYRHPLYGEMYIADDQLRLVQKICSTISRDGTPKGMLEITNPYANWFCDVAPWHGYVQTWYDTVSPLVIQQLAGELKQAPPEWIVYQRSIETMEQHEIVFNHGQPLAHRELDSLIMKRLAAGQWTLAYAQSFLGADWMVIRTVPTSSTAGR